MNPMLDYIRKDVAARDLCGHEDGSDPNWRTICTLPKPCPNHEAARQTGQSDAKHAKASSRAGEPRG